MAQVPNRIFGIECGICCCVSSRWLSCQRCGAESYGLEYSAIATKHFQIVDGVLRRLFIWHKNPMPCACASDGIWLSDGPAVEIKDNG